MDRAIADLATRQGGVVGRTQLYRLGLGRGAIDARLLGGSLLLVHRGVYAVGHQALRSAGWRHAALLAVANGAVLSHLTAAVLWDLLSAGSSVHVAVPGRTGRVRHRGVVVHRPRSLPPEEVTVHDGCPVTTVARTLVDLAAVVSERRLERAVAEAERLGRFDLHSLQRVLSHSRGRQGMVALRRVVSRADLGVTRSDLEIAFRELCRRAEVAPPLTGAWIDLGAGGGYEPDFFWPDRRLIIETDGFQIHGTRTAHRSDRRRDRRLRRSGYQVERFAWEDVFLLPIETTAEIADIVARHRPVAAREVV